MILLISLLILSLFMLLGMSYLLTANRRRPCFAVIGAIGSKTQQAAKDTTDSASTTLLCGQPDGASHGSTVGATVNPRVGKYFANSFLADKYGDWYEEVKLASIPLPVSGNSAMSVPFFTIDVIGPSTFGPTSTISAWRNANPGKSPDLGTHVGRILSIQSDLEPNAVFRIVAQKATSATVTRYLAHLVDPSASFERRNLVSGASVSIQGREFSGDSSDNYELHENYDAPDNRNFYMAWVQSDALLGRDQKPGTGDEPADGHRFVIPSFHRPDKLLAAVKSGGAFYTDWLSDPISLLRPAGRMSWDPDIDWSKYKLAGPPALPTGNALEHPNFTGGNVRTTRGVPQYFDPIHGPWDVDNDGDGITDSIWLDVGMSSVTIGSTQVQPLVAMMVLDLDGRINVNAHGTHRDLNRSLMRAAPSSLPGYRYAGTVTTVASGTAGPKQAVLPPGQGWGVADIDPRHVFLGANAATVMKLLLQGSESTGASTPGGRETPSIKAEGRFGDSAGGSAALAPAPGYLAKNDPGIDAINAQPRDASVPDSYGTGHAFRSPIDPQGRMTVGLDQMGQPLFDRLEDVLAAPSSRWSQDQIDDPYDVSLGRRALRPGWAYDPNVQSVPSTLQDNLFTAPQFERLLRLFEPAADALSPRLVSLLGPSAETARVAATIESWDTPAITVPRVRLEPLLELSDQADSSRTSLVSWDVALGLRMDVNRPFGDGLDNDLDGIVDEPGEYLAEVAADAYGTRGSTFEQQCLTNGRDVDGDKDVDNDDQQLARQLFARHLYVLARSMAPNLPPKEAAQWAVNVVDMRDPDSIITRFPFDATSPGNAGWDPTTAANKGNVVWGCERPDLLITEAMAWRNIRFDTNRLSGTPEYSDKGTGGLVVELYSPWTGLTTAGGALSSASPSELISKSDVASQGLTLAPFYFGCRIDLATVNAKKEPVFQIVAVREMAETGSSTLASLEADPTWPAVTVTDGSINGLVIYPAKASGTAVPVMGSMGTFVSGTGPDVDATTIAPGQFAFISGPIKSGTVLSNTVDISASGTAGMEFNYLTFSDKQSQQVLQFTGGLTETISGSNGFVPANRTGGKNSYPSNASSGPVGAMVCVEDPGKPASPLRFLAKSGTTTDLSYMASEKYRILLRRLANPLAAYDPVLNPYICVDSIVVQDQAIVAGSPGPGGTLKSAERCAAQPVDRSVNNLWRHTTTDDDANTLGLAPPLMGPVSGVEASLGFLPARLRVPWGGDALADAEQPVFPWLTWLNRQFNSEHELLLVPKSSPATLLRDHTHEWPFKHLFFQLGSGTNTAETELQQDKIGILEMLRVPSRFADSETRLPPADAMAVSATLASLGGKPMYLPPHNYLSHFREPGRVNLNTMSSSAVWAAINNGLPGAPYEDEVAYRDDGFPLPFEKSEDWTLLSGARSSPASGNWQLDNSEDTDGDGMLDVNHDENNDGQQQVSRSPMLRSIAASRRGWPIADDGSAPPILGQFDRVLNRGGVSGDTRLWFSKPFQSGWRSTPNVYAVDQSLLFRNWAPGDDTGPVYLMATNLALNDSKGKARNARPYADSTRNPFFRYREMMRLSNLVSPRSNVFAVWMTVGFFVIEPHPTRLGQTALGSEYGLDTGANVRFKSFMIIDRSIPVGFRPGTPLNSRDSVLLDHFGS